MKIYHFCLSILVAIVCLSCNQSGEQFTPYIQVSDFYLNPVYRGDSLIAAEDTLSYTSVDGVCVLDTVDVGDTVVFYSLYGSYSNDLIASRVKFDTTQLDMRAKLNESFLAVLLEKSDIRTIQLYYSAGLSMVAFPIEYTTLKSGDYSFSLIVESDSKFSPSTWQFKQPVR